MLAQWVMWYGFLLSYVIMIAFFLLTPTCVFITRFNRAMTILAPGTPDYYHYVLTKPPRMASRLFAAGHGPQHSSSFP